MKIAVFGAGAVGGHLAARLGAGAAAAGIEVSAVARGAQLAAIAERGITLWIGAERYSSPIRATDRSETLGVQDVVFVALKSSVLPTAAPGIVPLLGPDTSNRFRDERHPLVVPLSLPGERPAAPRSVAARSGRRLGAHDRPRTGHRLHDQLGQRGHRAGRHPQFAGNPATGSPSASPTARSRAASRRSGRVRSRRRRGADQHRRSASRSGTSSCATSAPARSAR